MGVGGGGAGGGVEEGADGAHVADFRVECERGVYGLLPFVARREDARLVVGGAVVGEDEGAEEVGVDVARGARDLEPRVEGLGRRDAGLEHEVQGGEGLRAGGGVGAVAGVRREGDVAAVDDDAPLRVDGGAPAVGDAEGLSLEGGAGEAVGVLDGDLQAPGGELGEAAAELEPLLREGHGGGVVGDAREGARGLDVDEGQAEGAVGQDDGEDPLVAGADERGGDGDVALVGVGRGVAARLPLRVEGGHQHLVLEDEAAGARVGQRLGPRVAVVAVVRPAHEGAGGAPAAALGVEDAYVGGAGGLVLVVGAGGEGGGGAGLGAAGAAGIERDVPVGDGDADEEGLVGAAVGYRADGGAGGGVAQLEEVRQRVVERAGGGARDLDLALGGLGRARVLAAEAEAGLAALVAVADLDREPSLRRGGGEGARAAHADQLEVVLLAGADARAAGGGRALEEHVARDAEGYRLAGRVVRELDGLGAAVGGQQVVGREEAGVGRLDGRGDGGAGRGRGLGDDLDVDADALAEGEGAEVGLDGGLAALGLDALGGGLAPGDALHGVPVGEADDDVGLVVVLDVDADEGGHAVGDGEGARDPGDGAVGLVGVAGDGGGRPRVGVGDEGVLGGAHGEDDGAAREEVGVLLGDQVEGDAALAGRDGEDGGGGRREGGGVDDDARGDGGGRGLAPRARGEAVGGRAQGEFAGAGRVVLAGRGEGDADGLDADQEGGREVGGVRQLYREGHRVALGQGGRARAVAPRVGGGGGAGDGVVAQQQAHGGVEAREALADAEDFGDAAVGQPDGALEGAPVGGGARLDQRELVDLGALHPVVLQDDELREAGLLAVGDADGLGAPVGGDEVVQGEAGVVALAGGGARGVGRDDDHDVAPGGVGGAEVDGRAQAQRAAVDDALPRRLPHPLGGRDHVVAAQPLDLGEFGGAGRARAGVVVDQVDGRGGEDARGAEARGVAGEGGRGAGEGGGGRRVGRDGDELDLDGARAAEGRVVYRVDQEGGGGGTGGHGEHMRGVAAQRGAAAVGRVGGGRQRVAADGLEGVVGARDGGAAHAHEEVQVGDVRAADGGDDAPQVDAVVVDVGGGVAALGQIDDRVGGEDGAYRQPRRVGDGDGEVGAGREARGDDGRAVLGDVAGEAREGGRGGVGGHGGEGDLGRGALPDGVGDRRDRHDDGGLARRDGGDAGAEAGGAVELGEVGGLGGGAVVGGDEGPGDGDVAVGGERGVGRVVGVGGEAEHEGVGGAAPGALAVGGYALGRGEGGLAARGAEDQVGGGDVVLYERGGGVAAVGEGQAEVGEVGARQRGGELDVGVGREHAVGGGGGQGLDGGGVVLAGVAGADGEGGGAEARVVGLDDDVEGLEEAAAQRPVDRQVDALGAAGGDGDGDGGRGRGVVAGDGEQVRRGQAPGVGARARAVDDGEADELELLLELVVVDDGEGDGLDEGGAGGAAREDDLGGLLRLVDAVYRPGEVVAEVGVLAAPARGRGRDVEQEGGGAVGGADAEREGQLHGGGRGLGGGGAQGRRARAD